MPKAECEYARSEGLTGQVMATLKQSPHPVFQKMCLTDLPSELLHIIVRSTDHNEARLLGSTCKLLRDISRFYIYRVGLIYLAKLAID